MMTYFILLLSTLAATGKALLCKSLGVGGYSAKQTILLNCKSFFVACVCSLLFVIADLPMLFSVSVFSVVLSVFFGFSVAVTQILQAKAMGKGPASMVTLIYSCGFLLPVFYGVAFWGEQVSVFQWIGVFLLLPVLFLIMGRKSEKTVLFHWLPFAFAAMIGSGTNAIFQKTHQYSDHAAELPFFLVYALFFSAVFTGIACFFVREKKASGPRACKWHKDEWLPLCLGVCVGALNFLNLHLAGKLPSVVHFPVYNIGSLLLTSILSAILYKDKPTPRQSAGFVLGIAAILLIGLL